MSLPAVPRELTFNERRYIRVYAFCASWEWKRVGATRRQLGTLLGLTPDGSGLAKVLADMEAAGWLDRTRDTASQYAPTRYRARGCEDRRLWRWHLDHYGKD